MDDYVNIGADMEFAKLSKLTQFSTKIKTTSPKAYETLNQKSFNNHNSMSPFRVSQRSPYYDATNYNTNKSIQVRYSELDPIESSIMSNLEVNQGFPRNVPEQIEPQLSVKRIIKRKKRRSESQVHIK